MRAYEVYYKLQIAGPKSCCVLWCAHVCRSYPAFTFKENHCISLATWKTLPLVVKQLLKNVESVGRSEYMANKSRYLAPMKSRNAYILFCSEQRRLEYDNEVDARGLALRLGKKWVELTVEEKNVWSEKEIEERKRFCAEAIEWCRLMADLHMEIMSWARAWSNPLTIK